MHSIIEESKRAGIKVRGLGAGILRAAFLILLLTQGGFASVQERDKDSPGSLSDALAVRDGKLTITLYMADAATGAIYSYSLSPGDNKPLSPKDFRLFYRFRAYKLSALAYKDGSLYVCASQPPTIFQLNVETLKEKVLWKGEPLINPTSIAVSDTGEVAIADTNSIFWLGGSPSAQQGPPSPTIREDKRFGNPSRLVFAGYKLLVLDDGGENIVAPLRKSDSEKEILVGSAVLKDEGKLLKIKDFAFYRGVYYIADARQIVSYIQNANSILPIALKDPFLNPSRILLTEEKLFIATKNTILNIPRLVPVSVTLNADQMKSNEALIALYQYLFSRGILPTRRHIAGRPYNNLEQMLLEKNLLISGFNDKEPYPENSAKVVLARLICKLNRDLCNRFSGTENQALEIPIVIREELTLPDVTINRGLTTSRVDLAGKSVSQHLRERVPSEKEREKIDVKYLSRINPSLSRTMEAELGRYDFITATPRQELGVGTTLAFDRGQEFITGVVEKCGVKLHVKQGRITLPELITSQANADFLPRDFGQNNMKIDLGKFGVENIEFHFDQPTIETLDRGLLTESLNNLEGRPCININNKMNNYIILDALKVSGGRYRFLRKDGSVVRVKDEYLRDWGLLGRADPSEKWSIIVDKPYYIGYRVAAWDPSREGVRSGWFSDIEDPGKIKPGSSQDIFNMKSGTLNLPAMQWRLSVHVSANDLNNESSELRKLESAYPGFRVLSKEELPKLDNSYAVGTNPHLFFDDFETVRSNRQDLKKAITYLSSATSGQGVIIGVGENSNSVDRRHPDFIDNGYSAWFKVSEDGSADFEPAPASGVAPAERTIKKFNSESDHGTHVAGLLAARERSLTPGLLPAAGLILIDSSSSYKLQQSIQDAITHGVYLFNFSFTMPGDTQTSNTLRNLKSGMRDNWKDQLFVVAAGNENQDLKDYELVPLKWIGEVKNMIGVAASIGRQSFLGNWEDEENITRLGSNYSKKYVQLVAPGFKIYSTASNNSYAFATGTSQAVPQVTAAAALLWGKGINDPLKIKARLIYTADWFDYFDQKVWGGLLNVDRAVREPNRDYISTQSNPKKDKLISVRGVAVIKVLAGQVDDPNDMRVGLPSQIPFHKILRIARLPDGTYRVFYLDGITLRVIMNAVLEGEIQCEQLLEWDQGTQSFKDTPDSRNECKKISVSRIYDYVAKVPPSVTF